MIPRFVSSLAIAFCLVLLATGAALAYEPGEVLDDPALEARARALSSELRCMVCQNQSIDESSAPLARDLRLLVRARLVAGDTDEEVLDFVVDRYGEFVLLRPRVAPHTWLLWFGPFIVLLLGIVATRFYLRRHAAPAGGDAERALSPEEEARVENLLKADASPGEGGTPRN